jgi:tetratricopeptide (TPR) repeat protein
MENKNQELNINKIVKPDAPKQNSFNTSAEIRLDQSTKFFLQGKRLLDSGDYDGAINNLQKAIDALKNGDMNNEDKALFYSHLGLAMQRKGWSSYAQAQFQIALKLNPNEQIAIDGLNSSGSPSPKEEKPKSNSTPNSKEVKSGENSIIVKFKSFFKK